MTGFFNRRLLNHVLFWLFYLFAYTINYTFGSDMQDRPLGGSLYFLPGHMLFTYSQMYWAVPRYLLVKKYARYFLASIGLLTLGLCCARASAYFYYDHAVYPYRFFTSFIQTGRSAFSFLPVAGLGISIKLLKEWYGQKERALQAEKEKIKIELEMLRSQVHPHFLFNTLNNLYSLILSSSPAASTVVLHLSNFLRYILYECGGNEISLQKEIEMLKKYIELEKLRYGNRVDVGFTFSGEAGNVTIAPLILLSFVENSFKHGVSKQLEQSWINIDIHIKGSRLHFQVTNSRVMGAQHRFGGVGLQNVGKRLSILYPSSHQLKITEEEQMYILQLEIDLSGSNSKTYTTLDRVAVNDYE